MSKNTNISELINYISVNGSGDIVMTGNLIMPGGAQAATQTYVTTAISNLVASSPATLDTLNELALALGSDPNFATTVATSIGTKQPQLNGTGFVKASGTTISYDNSTYALDSAVVKLTGIQTISGVKTFTGAGNTFTQNTNFLDRIYLRSATTTDYTNLSGHTNQLLVGVIGATHILSFPENTNYTYTFPAASGTVALTSNLSSYLPLAGGTLSGDLTITKSSAASFITNNTSASGKSYRLVSTDAGTFVIQNTGILDLVTIASTGAATFSSSVTSGVLYPSNIQAKGTTAADITYRLEPYTNAYASKLLISSTSSGDGGMRYGVGGGNTMQIFSYGDMSFGVGTTNISGNVGDTRMTITSGGNIITTAPTSGSGITIGRAAGNASIKGDGYLIMDSLGAATAINYYVSDNIWLANGGGNVLIGTSTDNAGKLQVNGEIRMYGSTLFRGMSSNTLQLCGGTSSSNVKIDGSVEVITMDTNGATRLTIGASGRVGINDGVSTNAQLALNGSVKINRSLYNWYQESYVGNSTYLHIKTNLWAGGSPNGNSEYTMSLFKGYMYAYGTPPALEGTIVFHNWDGNFYNIGTTGNLFVTAYRSADGYVVLVTNSGSGEAGITIDWHQAYGYPYKDRIRTASKLHGATTGGY